MRKEVIVKAKEGDYIKLFLKGKLLNGKTVFSNIGKEPIEFKIGEGKLIQGIEEGVIDMSAGETKEVTIPPEKAFGYHSKDFIMEFPKNKFPASPLNIGQSINFEDTKTGRKAQGKVINIGRETITCDFNNPLVGKTLKFEIEITNIKRIGN